METRRVSEDVSGSSSLTRRVSIGVSGKCELFVGKPQSRYFPLPQTLSLGQNVSNQNHNRGAMASVLQPNGSILLP